MSVLSEAVVAASLCGWVLVKGRPLPFGMVELRPEGASGGPAFEAMTPVDHGSFCRERLAFGRYRLSVYPLSLDAPMPLRVAGLEDGATEYAFEHSGAGELSVSYAEEPASLEVAARIRFEPESSDGDAGRGGPYLFGAALFDGHSTRAGLAWVGAPAARRALPRGRYQAVAWAGSLPITGTSPPLERGESPRTEDDLTVRLGREAGALSGTLRLPPGAALGPQPLRVVLQDMVGGYADVALVGAGGRYRFGRASKGWHRLNYAGLRGASGLAHGSYALVWIEPGRETVFDWDVAAAARLSVENAPPPPSPALHHAIRYIMGLPEGEAPPEAAAALLSEEEGAPVALAQETDGRWKSAYRFDRGADAAAYPAGRYDLYLSERQDPQDAIAVRPLAALRGVRLDPRETAVLRFPGAAASGSCALAGRLRLSKFRVSDAFTSRRRLAPVLQELVPHVHLFDAGGAYAGTAFAVVSDDELLELVKDVDDRRPERAASFLASKEWSYRIRNLAPGEYRLRFEAAGYAPVTRTATLEPGKTAALDVDFDAGGPR
jgi:hypothetical protein